MKKRILSVLTALCLVLTLMPAAGAIDFSAPTWNGWGTIDHDGKTAGMPIGSLLFDHDTENESIQESSAILKCNANGQSYVLYGGNGYAATDELPRLLPINTDDYNYDEEALWQGEYAITLFSTTAEPPLNVENLSDENTAFNDIEYQIKLVQGNAISSDGLGMTCTWERGDFGASTEKLTLSFTGTFSDGPYYCELEYPDDGGIERTLWLYGNEGTLVESGWQPVEIFYAEDDIPTCAPQLKLWKVDSSISGDKKVQTVVIHPQLTLTGTAPNEGGISAKEIFQVGEETFDTLSEAVSAAESGSDKTVTLLKSTTIATDEIADGVTLVIPSGRVLTIEDNASLTVKGTLQANGKNVVGASDAAKIVLDAGGSFTDGGAQVVTDAGTYVWGYLTSSNTAADVTKGEWKTAAEDMVCTTEYWKAVVENSTQSDGTYKPTWEALRNLPYFYDIVHDDIGSTYAAYRDRINAIGTFITSVDKLDMSGKLITSTAPTDDTGILASYTGLTELNLSNTGIDDIGGLADLISLETLDLSDNLGITDAGALQDLTALKSLDISDTGITDLNFMWKGSAAAFSRLTTLNAKNLALTSVAGLVEIVNDTNGGFTASSVTWDLSGSTLDGENAAAHLQRLSAVFSNSSNNFKAPTLPGDVVAYVDGAAKTSLSDAYTAAKQSDSSGQVVLAKEVIELKDRTDGIPQNVTLVVPDGVTVTVKEENTAAVLGGSQGTVSVEKGGKLNIAGMPMVGDETYNLNVISGSVDMDLSTVSTSQEIGVTINGTAEVPANQYWTTTSSKLGAKMNITVAGGSSLTVNGEFRVANGSTLTLNGDIAVGGLMGVRAQGKIRGAGKITVTGTLTLHKENANQAQFTPANIILSNNGVVYSQFQVTGIPDSGEATGSYPVKFIDSQDPFGYETLTFDHEYAIYYTVTVTTNADAGTSYTESVKAGTPFTLPAAPTSAPSGKTFGGWWVSGTLYNPGAQITVNGDVSVDAYWVTPGTTPTTPGTSTGGSSSSSSGDLITADRTTGGTVQIRPGRAEAGDTVTITATPNDGYEVGEVVVTDASGKEISVRSEGDNRYTFTMPSSKVNVDVNFVRIGSQQTSSFWDVSTAAYYYDAVQWAVEQGITTGTTATSFSPNAGCTRAQIVTFLWRANGSPAPRTTTNPFTDLSPSAYYYDAVLWAVEEGITSGATASTFGPNSTCTRAQAATFLWRAEGSPTVGGSDFSDVADDAYYAGAVDWAVANGVTQGISASTFGPNSTCTRAQIVTFLYRAMA